MMLASPESKYGSEEDACHIVGCELVVAGGDASPVLQAAPEAFDEVAGSIGVTIIGDRFFAAAGSGDDDLGTLGLDRGADGIAVIATVGNEPVEAAMCSFDQGGRDGHVGEAAGRDQQDAWPSGSIGQSVDFAGASAARGSDALSESPLLRRLPNDEP